MKTLLLKSVFLCTFLANNLQAQEQTVPFLRHFISVSVGPSFATGKQAGSTVEQNANGTETLHYQEYGFGKGFSMALGYNFMFSRELGLELNATRLFGSAVKYDNVYYHQNGSNSYQVKQHNELKAGIWKFNFLLVAKIPYRKVSPYFKGGVIMSTGNKITRETTEDVKFTNGFTQKGNFEVQNTGGTSAGINAVMGIEVPVSGAIFFFAELNYTSLNYKFKKWEQRKYEIDGKDMLATLPQDQKSGNYSDAVSSNQSGNLTWKPSLSSLSIMVGMKVALYRPREK